MSSSPVQDLLDRIDRLHLMLTSDLPRLSPIIPQQSVPRILLNSIDPLITIKSEAMIIDELQQYIKKMEQEREILLRSYTLLLQLFKHPDPEEKIHFIEHEDSSEFFPCD